MASQDLLPTEVDLARGQRLLKDLVHYANGRGYERDDVLLLATALAAEREATLRNSRAAETELPVAWRWRYLHKGDGNDKWIVRQSPIASCEPRPGYVGIEVQPLYAAPKSAAETELREALETTRDLICQIYCDEEDEEAPHCSECREATAALSNTGASA